MKTLLLAESHPATLEHLRGVLTQAGYTVRAVTEPGKALEHFASDRPDVVLVAVDFPKLDQQHLAQLIRASDQGARIPLLVIDKGHLGRARGVSAILDLKANGYVPDPTKVPELLAKLKPLLESSPSAKGGGTTGVGAVLARPPVASGELKGFPLPALFNSFYRLHRDGVLVVAFRDLTRRVYFVRGRPANYDSTARQDAFANWLVERKELTESQSEAVLKALASGLRIGTALAEAGVALEGEELLQRLRDYTREKVAQLVGMREGRYAFYAGTEFTQEVAAMEIPALAAILEGARRTFPVKVFGAALRGRLHEFPQRTAEFGPDLPELGLDTDDLKIAMQMNGRIPMHDILAHGRGELRSTYSLVWFLNLTGDLRFSKTPLASTEAQPYAGSDKIAPKRRKPLPAELANQLRDSAVKIITGSYFRVLGLDITADTEQVEEAYHEVARRFHADNYSEFDTSEIQDLMDSVMDKLSASYRVLSVEEKRKAYVQYLFSRLDVGRSAEVSVDAEIALHRGTAALKRKDFSGAVRAFEEAVSVNPREPEYYSYLAWATYLGASRGTAAVERAKAAQKLLKKALGLNPTLERAIIISAIIEGETGDASVARKKLLKVLEQNPHAHLAKAALRKLGR
ncbi:MAG: DUF4388 domain-containing protein [Myxococcota bacterium]|nr:DUF4388 domain-containing protein [Myxococcota bacterium]